MPTFAVLVFLTYIAEPATIAIDRDNIAITQSCRLRVTASSITDADGNGVVHITADDITVEFIADSPPLHGAKPEQQPDSFAGTGLVITGRNVTLSGAKVSGYKVGIHAQQADGATIHHIDVSGNFAERLKSTPQAEDAGDWLWPHANDNNEWITNYGAGLCVEDSKGVTLHDIRARRTQNGIILDAVNDSKVYDCDCSFLSGWGLAMWRSSRNVISRNAFDFCVRGYSHGVYNRGQDSAGILMFEQCCDNVFAENSATHGGDGLFGFAGKEAIGEINPRPSPSAYKHRGNNGNTFVGNDFSFAAAHGLELTFSFRNRISNNVFRANAICGIWGGYSQATIIDHNVFASNGEGAYGMERGGINIEHGRYIMITGNRFEEDKCGVHLWWDEDQQLMSSVWGRANEPLSSNNFIVGNEFARTPVAIQLRQTTLTDVASNEFEDVPSPLDKDASSPADLQARPTVDVSSMKPASAEAIGSTRPVGARGELAGREHIIMTEWGPWDHASPLLQFLRTDGGCGHIYRVHGVPLDRDLARQLITNGNVFYEISSDGLAIRSSNMLSLTPYEVRLDGGSAPDCVMRGVLACTSWEVTTFPSAIDPRADIAAWRKQAPSGAEILVDDLHLPFGSKGMSELHTTVEPLPHDQFGCIATRTLAFPAGKYRLNTTSDDGIRVWLDDSLVIDDWTHHAPRRQTHDFEVLEPREITMRVEYFELDGHAVLEVAIESVG